VLPRGESPRALAVLPARIGSTRLPAKVLLAETGKPLVIHTAEATARATGVDKVLIATDGEQVLRHAEQYGFEALLTSPEHASGTDRVNEAVQLLGGHWDVVLGVQADEPELDPEDLNRLIEAFVDPRIEAATLATPIEDPTELASTNVVKVVRDQSGDALLFSRAPIPCRDHAREGSPASPLALRHIGIYAFRPAALAEFCALPAGTLEGIENLEQLRWLEAGRPMRVLDAGHAPRGIDTPEDYRAFVERQRSPEQHESSQ
jgi:3-deoxy-manno-octulosonate cytidylyltransferase (CMP-KDO synthetase)